MIGHCSNSAAPLLAQRKLEEGSKKAQSMPHFSPLSAFFQPLFSFVILVFLISPVHAQWYNLDWTHRVKVSINASQVNGDLSNFPIYIDLSNLPDTFFDHVTASGGDIRVTKDDGLTEIAREVVSVDKTANGGELHFIANGTLSSSTNTNFYIYYGNPASSEPAASSTYGSQKVWANDYVGVWHLQEEPGGASDIKDSTSFANHGTSAGSMDANDDLPGKLATALDLDGSNDVINVSDSSSLDTISDLTASIWVNPDILPSAGNKYFLNRLPSNQFALGFAAGGADNLQTWISFSGSCHMTGSLLTNGTWHYTSLTLNGSEARLYLNGSIDDSTACAGNPTATGADFHIGSYDDPSNSNWSFDGLLDEVRLAKTARSNDWLKTEYNNQNSPSSFYGVSQEETKVAWFNTAWQYRIPITINSTQVNGDLSNFPIYINLNSLNGSGFFTQVRSDGGDIRMTKADGISQVAREVVSIDTANGTGELHFVANGTLSASYGDTFYIYYGNSSATEPSAASSFGSENVWTEGFVGVWHMQQSPVNGSAAITDSSSYSYNASPMGGMNASDLVTGQLGKSIDFDGTNDYINAGNGTAFDFDNTDSYSASVWFKISGGSGLRDILHKRSVSSANPVPFEIIIAGDHKVQFSVWDTSNTIDPKSAAAKNDSAWHQAYATYNGGPKTGSLYVDGIFENNETIGGMGTLKNSEDLIIGSDITLSREFPGTIDEVRISNKIRSANWISAEYNNQNSPNSFYAIGTQSKYSNWLDIHWTNRIQFTVQASQINGDLSNFPVYVDLNLFNGSEFFTRVRSDGGDIRMTKADGISQVAREVVTIDTANGTGELHFVANGTLSGSTNGDYYIYYGNAVAQDLGASGLYGRQNVWKNGFLGVWHLNEAVNNNADGYQDSSPNTNHLKGTSMALTEVQGKLSGKGQNFDGAADYLFKSGASLNGSAEGTLSTWFKTGTGQSNRYMVSLPNSSAGNNGFDIRFPNSTSIASSGLTSNGASTLTSTQTYSNSTWHFFQSNFDGSNRKIFFNGAEVSNSTQNGTLLQGANEINIARFGSFGAHYLGELDEVRVSSLSRSNNWIATEYSNQNSPSSFISVSNGSEGQNMEASWSKKIKITIQASQVNGDLSNFPVYIALNDLNGTSFFNNVKGNGADIRITKADQATLLATELVSIDTNNGTGELWFKADSLSGSTNTDFYLWFGNNGASAYAADSSLGAQQVWTSNFDGVWHLGEEGNTDDNGYKDSTNNAYHGNGVSMTTASDIAGQLGRAQDFDGTADYIQLGSRTMAANESFTVSAWLYPRSNTGTERAFFSHADGGEVFSVMASRGSADNTWAHYMSSGGYQNGPAVIQNQWQYLVFKYDGTNRETFIDASSAIGPSGGGHPGGTRRMQIGRWYPTSNNYYFNGSIDEIRIADTARSINWIKTEYNNQNAPSSFYEIEEEIGGGVFDWSLF